MGKNKGPRTKDRLGNPKSKTQNCMINIHLNGEARQVPEGLTLAALLDWLHLPADRLAVERNLEIVPRGQWDQTMIGEGDRLEVVQFVGGGRGYFGF